MIIKMGEEIDHNILQEGEFQSNYEPKEILGKWDDVIIKN